MRPVQPKAPDTACASGRWRPVATTRLTEGLWPHDLVVQSGPDRIAPTFLHMVSDLSMLHTGKMMAGSRRRMQADVVPSAGDVAHHAAYIF
ncbi:hypothetical protein Q4610_15420 [Sphingobium sp. HBC34]|uniref:Uncharacterized protein n=1 Tax=Sphingobium cyanobacteriorum TaxID=3063954 RepID=A0ABT8ZR59_9SPHN|nr:hypothetical protein [Sphingobium sp. HBC34]MDO7836439.1 hypothetical protein [Sphingobium sp. HBC34]